MASRSAAAGAAPAPRRAHARVLTTAGAARIAAVVLAAGGSTRLGYPKQMILHEGKPLVAHAAGVAADAEADPVIVVLGARADEIRPAVASLAGVTVVVNSEWESGLASSLATGIRAALADATCDGIMITLADQPMVSAELLRRLMTAFRGGARVVASGYDGSPGVPALFGREHASDLLGLTGDAGAGPWLRSRLREVTIVPLDSAMVDLDTPADVTRLADPAGPG